MAGALAVPVTATSVLASSDASASVSIAVAFENLLKDADDVVVVTPAEQQAVWEDGRIYTYTHVRFDQGIAGDLGAGGEGWVRTMGGVVGKIGQMVDGEPVLVAGKPSVLFLRKFKEGAVYEVSARAQGQYPIQIDEKTKVRKLIRSANAGVLLPPKEKSPAASSQITTQSTTSSGGASASAVEMSPALARLAQDVLHDRPLDDVSREIQTTWKRLHTATPAK